MLEAEVDMFYVNMFTHQTKLKFYLTLEIYSNSIYQENVMGKYHSPASTQMYFIPSVTCLRLSILLGNGVSGYTQGLEIMLLVKW